MKKPTNRLMAAFLSVLLILAPVLASAEEAASMPQGVFSLSFSDPVIHLMGTEYDMSGLELSLKAAPGQAGADLMLSVLTNGISAFGAYASVNENGLNAIIDGMTSALNVPMETLQQMLSSLTQVSIPDVASFDPATLFTEEDIAAMTDAVNAFSASLLAGEPVEDTINMGENDVACVRYDFAITNDALCALVSSVMGVMESKPAFSAMFAAALAKEGLENTTATDLIVNSIAESGISAEGSAYKTEAGDIVVLGNLAAAQYDETTTLPFEMAVYADENGGSNFSLTIYDETETNSIDIYVSVAPNTEVEGMTDFYFDFGAWTEDDGEYESVASFTTMLTASLTEDGTDYTLSFDLSADDESVMLFFDYKDGEQTDEFSIYFETTSGEDEYAETISLGFNFESAGVQTETYIGTAGVATLSMNQNDMTVFDCSINLACGMDLSGESIAYDFSGVPAIDALSIDEETLTAIMGEALNAAYGLLAAMQANVPGFAALINDMTQTPTSDSAVQ